MVVRHSQEGKRKKRTAYLSNGRGKHKLMGRGRSSEWLHDLHGPLRKRPESGDDLNLGGAEEKLHGGTGRGFLQGDAHERKGVKKFPKEREKTLSCSEGERDLTSMCLPIYWKRSKINEKMSALSFQQGGEKSGEKGESPAIRAKRGVLFPQF